LNHQASKLKNKNSINLCELRDTEREIESRRGEEMAEARAGGGCCPPMDLFRSEAMQLVQLIIPIESAHHTVSYLGDLGLLQFKDVRTHSSILAL
jgi:hypothetical protein